MRGGPWLVLAVLAACGGDPELAPVPDVELSTLDPSLADRIREARERLDGDGTGENFGRLGMLLHAAERLEAAAVCYENAAARAPGEARWPYYLGHLHRKAGRSGAALAAFDRASSRMSAESDAVQRAALECWRGDLLLDEGRAEEAARAFRQALTAGAPRAYAHFGLARAALQEGDDAEALAQLRRANALAPRARNVHHLLGSVCRRRGDLAESRRHLERSEDVRSPSLGILDPLLRELQDAAPTAQGRIELGARMLEAGRYERAEAAYREALKLQPDNRRARLGLGAALRGKGDFEAAEREFRAFLAKAPDDFEARVQLAALLARTGRDDPAVTYYRAALTQRPDHVGARLNLANALARLGRHEAAHEQYAAVIGVSDTNETAQLGAARMLVVLDRHREALDSLAAARKLLPESDALAHDLARLLVASSDDTVRDARRGLDLANALLRKRPELQFGETVAMGHASLGEFRKAVEIQQEALEAARRLRLEKDIARIEANLELYRARKPCRTPWRAEDVVAAPE